METKVIGGRIAQARKKQNFSQAQLADQLFISPQAVGKWERGESVPDILMVNKLASILDVDLNYFSGRSSAEDNEDTAPAPSDTAANEPRPGGRKSKLGWDMSKGNWVNADFSGLKDLHEKFSSSNMEGCKFIGSDLSALLLSSNNVDGCDFSSSALIGSRIRSSNLNGDMFKGSFLQGTEFSGSNIEGCDFTGAELHGARFRMCSFESNTMKDAILDRTVFELTQIKDVVFDGTIKDCSFDNCEFSRVTFRNVKLISTFFKGRSMKRIHFVDSEADRLTYEFLKNAKADLTGLTVVAA